MFNVLCFKPYHRLGNKSVFYGNNIVLIMFPTILVRILVKDLQMSAHLAPYRLMVMDE